MKFISTWLNTRLIHFLGAVQEPWYTWFNALANAWIRFMHPERITHPGELHPDKTFIHLFIRSLACICKFFEELKNLLFVLLVVFGNHVPSPFYTFLPVQTRNIMNNLQIELY